MIRGNKAQITIFVIIGIAILAGVGVYLYFTQSSTSLTNEFENDITKARPQFKPVQDYVELCMGEVTRDGLVLLGAHGGYIDPFEPEYGAFFEYQESAIHGDNDGVLLGSDKSSMVPYWIKSTTPVEKDFLNIKVDIPTFEEIESQIELYVDENLDTCLNNLSALKQLGYEVIIYGDATSKAIITDDDVVVKTNMTLLLQKGEEKQQFDVFLVRDPVPLADYLTKASLILYEEYNSQYLENLIMQLVGYYGRLDSGSIPPISLYSNDRSPVVWTQFKIRDNLKGLLNSYVSLFRFAQTENEILFDGEHLSEQEKSFYYSFLLTSLYSYTENLTVNHIFLDWDIYSKVTSPSSSGEVVTVTPKSRSGFMMKEPEVDTTYDFYYDVTYPVIVELSNSELADGSSYTFLFAMEANLRNNLNHNDYREGRGPIEWDPSKIFYTSIGASTDIDDATEDDIGYYPLKTLFKEQSQYDSAPVSLEVVDSVTRRPLAGVQVSVGLADYGQKQVGVTEFDVYGNAKFKSKLPLLKNGYLKLEKEGYLEKYVLLSTYETQRVDFGSVPMDKFKTKKVNVTVLQEEELTPGVFTTTEREILPEEELMFFFTKMSDQDDFSAFSQILIVTNDTSEQEIDFVPGKYTIAGMLIDKKGVTVKAGTYDVCQGVENCDEDKLPEEDLILGNMSWGGVEFNLTNYWTLETDDLYNDSNILEFKMLKFTPPNDIMDLSKLSNLSKKTAYYQDNLTPNFTQIMPVVI